jgi:threonine aldolase
MAAKLRAKFQELGYCFFMSPETNQLFPILPKRVREALGEKYTFIEMDSVGDDSRVCRFCTSWATLEENVEALCADLEKISRA